MNENLDGVLLDLGNTFASEILPDSRYYLEVDIGKRGEQLGAPLVGKRYREVKAIVPVELPRPRDPFAPACEALRRQLTQYLKDEVDKAFAEQEGVLAAS